MPDYRKSALVIHSLALGDQKWLLDRLPLEHQEKLSSLLIELETLGIPKHGLDESLLEPHNKNTPEGLPPVEVDMVSSAGNEEISNILLDEPIGVLASILSVHNWPWQQAVICGFSVEQQNEILKIVEVNRRKGLPLLVRRAVVLSIAKILDENRSCFEEEASPCSVSFSQPKRSLMTGFRRFLWPA